MTPPRRGSLLLVSYFYPPTRDTGAQRPAAMAKWLSRLGWDVTVLTTSAFGEVRGSEGEKPAGPDDEGIETLRTRDMQTWRVRLAGHERVASLFDSDSYSGKAHSLSKVIVPEPLALAWAPFAVRVALRAHRKRPFDCVLTTSPPESAHAVGRALQRRGVAWVAELRDAWTYEPLRPPFPTRLQDRLDERLERRWLGAADAVVCVSEPAATDMRERGIAVPRVIANAWDPDDDPSAVAITSTEGLLDPDRISLLYTGRFGGYGRDPRALVEALGRLADEEPEIAGKLELAIAGPLTPAERELFEGAADAARITLLGSLERERSLALQRRADALLLLAQPARSQLLNFKLFEYLAAERPILALASGTEAGRIAADVGIRPIVPANDATAIVAALTTLAGGGVEGPDADAASRYSYPAAAEAMSEVLGSLVPSSTGQAGDSVAQNSDFFARETYSRNADRLDSHALIRRRLTAELAGSKRLLDVGNGGVFEYDPAVAEEIVAVDLFLDESDSPRFPENVEVRRG
ncbi:MAG: glycosyltransferase, partial [Solirubrobacterales bacterium]